MLKCDGPYIARLCVDGHLHRKRYSSSKDLVHTNKLVVKGQVTLRFKQGKHFVPGSQSIQSLSLQLMDSFGRESGLHMSSSGHRTSLVFMPEPQVTEHVDHGDKIHSRQGAFFSAIVTKLLQKVQHREQIFFTSLHDSTSSGLSSVQRASSTKVDVVVS